MADKKKAPPKGKPTQGAPLKIAGRFVQEVMSTPTTALSVLTTIGEGEEASFLVPFAYLSILESGEGEASEVMTAFLTLDSAVYLVADLAAELATAADRVEELSTAERPLEPSRIKAMREYVDSARKQLDTISGTLERLGAGRTATS